MKTIKILLILLLAGNGIAQENYLNTVYFEILGTGGMFSVNYERQLGMSSNFSIHSGLGYLPEIFSPESITIPYGVKHNLKLGKRTRFTTGLNATAILNGQSGDFWNHIYRPPSDRGVRNIFFASLGFKMYFGGHQKYMWKLYTALPFAQTLKGAFEFEPSIPWAGVSIGARF